MASLNLKSGLLGERLAAHLLRRATFGFTKPELNAFASMTAKSAVESLLNIPPDPPAPIDPETGATWVIYGRTKGVNSSKLRLNRYVNAWWLHYVLQPPFLSVVSKMEFFLHTCFTTDMHRMDSEDNYYLFRLFRMFALGNYRILAQKISVDNSMLEYLDTYLSKKQAPNENYAREFLELFTIGKGPQIGPGNYTTYTEQDIKEAAKILTGFRQNHKWWQNSAKDPDTGLPRGKTKLNSHDKGDKYFSDAFVSSKFSSPVTITGRKNSSGMYEELNEFVDMVFAQPATAYHITRKLYRFFVHYEITPEVENDIIQPLGDLFFQSDYNLEVLVKTLLQSEHFFDVANIDESKVALGALIRNPLELLVSSIRFFQIEMPDPYVDLEEYMLDFHKKIIQDFLLSGYGMQLFSPPTVAGYPAYHQEPGLNRLWAAPNTLPFRYRLGEMLLAGKKNVAPGSLRMQLDPVAVVSNPDIVAPLTAPDPYTGVVGTYAGGRFAAHLVRSIVDYVFPVELSAQRLSYFVDDLLLDNLSPINWRMEWVAYEQSGDDSNIRPQLNAFFKGIFEAPEYQLA